jgi:hypothetical protein
MSRPANYEVVFDNRILQIYTDPRRNTYVVHRKRAPKGCLMTAAELDFYATAIRLRIKAGRSPNTAAVMGMYDVILYIKETREIAHWGTHYIFKVTAIEKARYMKLVQEMLATV